MENKDQHKKELLKINYIDRDGKKWKPGSGDWKGYQSNSKNDAINKFRTSLLRLFSYLSAFVIIFNNFTGIV